LRIAVDVESGERSFEELTRGVIKASEKFENVTCVLIGNQKKIENSFPDIHSIKSIELINSNEFVFMDEEPVRALKKKRNASVFVGTRMLRDGTADAFFSPGNTGATVAASVLTLGMVTGVKKPAIAAFFPREGGGETLIVDIGANPDATDEHIFHNAILGEAYFKTVWGVKTPRIGLLNIASELHKGSHKSKKALVHLSTLPNFIGNVEGYNIFSGSVDVVVCDGFTGNIILKTSEAMNGFVQSTLRDLFSGNSNGKKKNLFSFPFSMIGIFKEKKDSFVNRISPRYFGAAPLLGVKGLVLVGHGLCRSRDVVNAVELARQLHQGRFNERVISTVSGYRK
jgi:glycerol-3-phosphate acyltransferase PlsX